MITQNKTTATLSTRLVVVALAVVVAAGTAHLMAARGNQSDTGIMEEANALVQSGRADDVRGALDILLEEAKRAQDTQKQKRIQKTQKDRKTRNIKKRKGSEKSR